MSWILRALAIANVSQTNPDILGFNFINNQTAIVPVPIEGLTVTGSDSGSSMNWDVPAHSINVIEFWT